MCDERVAERESLYEWMGSGVESVCGAYVCVRES